MYGLICPPFSLTIWLVLDFIFFHTFSKFEYLQLQFLVHSILSPKVETAFEQKKQNVTHSPTKKTLKKSNLVTFRTTLSDLPSKIRHCRGFTSKFHRTLVAQCGEVPSCLGNRRSRKVQYLRQSIVAKHYFAVYIIHDWFGKEIRANYPCFMQSTPFHKLLGRYCNLFDSTGFSRLQNFAICLLKTPLVATMHSSRRTFLSRWQ